MWEGSGKILFSGHFTVKQGSYIAPQKHPGILAEQFNKTLWENPFKILIKVTNTSEAHLQINKSLWKVRYSIIYLK